MQEYTINTICKARSYGIFPFGKLFPSQKFWLVLVVLCLVGNFGCAGAPVERIKAGSLSEPHIAGGAGKTADTIHYAIFPAPPYMIGAGEEDADVSGIDVEIVSEIARRMKLKIEYIKCTWARCLELMKSGEADLLSSVFKKPERELYMLYFYRPILEHLPVAFYFLKGKNQSVNTYEDLYKLKSIGVLKGASYFEQFDKDSRIEKFEVASQDQLFPMLLSERLDAVAGYVPTENYQIQQGGFGDRIERSAFEYEEPTGIYIALSKRSPLRAKFEQINRVNQQLLDEGVISNIIIRYYEKYH